MHPCSHPRYGFKLVSKPTSGLVLRVMIVFVPSRKYCVRRRGLSSASQPGSTTSGSVRSMCSFSNRFAGLQDAPRPRIAARLCGASSTTDANLRCAMRVMFMWTCFLSSSFRSRKRWTPNAQRFSEFNVGRWTLDIGRCPAIPRRGGRAVDRAGLETAC